MPAVPADDERLDLPVSDDLALIEARSDQRLSFRELLERGARIADAAGTQRSLALLLARNDAFSAAAYVGCLQSVHAIALLDPATTAPQLAQIVDAYRPAAVMGAPGIGQALSAHGIRVIDAVEADSGEVARISSDAPPALDPRLKLLLSTSGTTGSRKFVRLSHRNVSSNASAISEYLQLSPGDRPISSLPMHYTFGLSVINSHLRAGAPVVLTEAGIMQPVFWEAFRAHGCTSLAGVPFTYRILERLGFREMDLPTLETLQQAGGALDRELTERYARYMAARGGRFFVMYGQTEATARISYVPAERLLDKIGSAGVAIPSGDLRIEPNGTNSADGYDIGEVVYRGPNVMLGYAESADHLSRGDEMGGILRTGDVGYLDDERFLYLVGRSKRIAKVFGHRISLDEVEALLAAEGPAAVVEGDDALWAFCEFGDAESLARLRGDLAHRLRVNKGHIHLQRVDAIPLSGSGKVDYPRLSELVRDALP
jgi:acyl-CoA synthetase (AMP-forming)/AMP-acid ligase II